MESAQESSTRAEYVEAKAPAGAPDGIKEDFFLELIFTQLLIVSYIEAHSLDDNV